MQIIEKRLDELQPYDNNPRKNDAAVPYVAESISRYGFKVPIVIDADGVIVAGHTRYLASIELGLDTVPCIVADDLTEDEIKEFRLVDNKVSEYAAWDMSALEEELADIDFGDFDFGFPEFEDINFDVEPEHKGNMAKQFLAPPFSVLFGNKGEWLERKRKWVAFGIRSELGRSGHLVYTMPDYIQRQAGGEQVIKQTHDKSQALSSNTIARFKQMQGR